MAHCSILIGAYKRPDLRGSFGGLWSKEWCGRREFPSDNVSLALLDAPPDSPLTFCLLLTLTATEHSLSPAHGTAEQLPKPRGRGSRLEYLVLGWGEEDGGSLGLPAVPRPRTEILQAW